MTDDDDESPCICEFETPFTCEQHPKRRPTMDARCAVKKCEQGCYTTCKAARDRKY